PLAVKLWSVGRTCCKNASDWTRERRRYRPDADGCRHGGQRLREHERRVADEPCRILVDVAPVELAHVLVQPLEILLAHPRAVLVDGLPDALLYLPLDRSPVCLALLGIEPGRVLLVLVVARGERGVGVVACDSLPLPYVEVHHVHG